MLLQIFVYIRFGEGCIGFVRETNYGRFFEVRTVVNPNIVA